MHEPLSKKTYYANAVALFVLLVVTLVAAELPLGIFGPAVAVSIAVLKALLIVLFFMNLYVATPLTRLVAIAGFLWLILLFVLMGSDYLTRV